MMKKFTTKWCFIYRYYLENHDLCIIPNDMLLWLVQLEIKTDVF